MVNTTHIFIIDSYFASVRNKVKYYDTIYYTYSLLLRSNTCRNNKNTNINNKSNNIDNKNKINNNNEGNITATATETEAERIIEKNQGVYACK